jgi:hypothetical protein
MPKPYPADMRARIDATIIQRVNEGWRQVDIARELGIQKSQITIFRRQLVFQGRLPEYTGGRRKKEDSELVRPKLPSGNDDHKKPSSDHVYAAKTRGCLMCGDKFISEWPGERVCKQCKQSVAWQTGTP